MSHQAVISANDVFHNESASDTNQLHHRVYVPVSRFFSTVPQHRFSYQLGRVDMSNAVDRSATQFLMMIDTVSRMVFVRLLRDESVHELITQYQDIIMKDLVPTQGVPAAVTASSEFDNPPFAGYNAVHGRNNLVAHRFRDSDDTDFIKLYLVRDEQLTRGNRLAILHRAIRSIKSLLGRYKTATRNTRWTDYLYSVTEWYNARNHRSLCESVAVTQDDGTVKMVKTCYSPKVVFHQKHADFYHKMHNHGNMHNQKLLQQSKINVGDLVRVVLANRQRQGTPNFSTDICTIVARDYCLDSSCVSPQSGFKYTVKCPGASNTKRFKEWELVLVKDEHRHKIFGSKPIVGRWTVVEIDAPPSRHV